MVSVDSYGFCVFFGCFLGIFFAVGNVREWGRRGFVLFLLILVVFNAAGVVFFFLCMLVFILLFTLLLCFLERFRETSLHTEATGISKSKFIGMRG